MFPFIQTILDGRKLFYWPMIMLECIHNQMLRVRETKSFFMTSYVIYATTRRGIFPRLNAVGVLGEAQGQKRV